MQKLKYLYKLTLNKKVKIIFFIISKILILLSNILMIAILGKFIDLLIYKKDFSIVYKFSFITFILIIVLTTFMFVSNILKTKLITEISYDINFQLIKKLKKVDLNLLNNYDSIYLSHKIYSDSSTISVFFVNNILDLIIQTITFISIIFLVLKINIEIAILMIIITPIYGYIYIKFKKPMYIRGLNVKEKQNKFFSIISNQLKNLKFIKLNSFYNETDSLINKEFKSLYKEIVKLNIVTSIFSLIGSSFNNLFKVVLIFLGGIKVIEGSLTIGMFTVINNYFSTFIKTCEYFFQFTKFYQDFLISYNRVIDIKSMKEEINGTKTLNSINTIKIENLNFGYDKKLFYNYNYRFDKGNIYYIKGENGVGKSTLIDLILGINSNYSGDILYNNINIKNLDLINIRKTKIGICEQFPYLINDSILNNLTYGIYNYNIEDVYKYINIFKLNKIMNYSYADINNIINTNNDNVSGGEKQKIVLSRLFIKNTDVIILDEPTSALDINSVNTLKYLLNELKKEKIIIIVSHDETFLDIVDYVIELKKYQYH